ncbi:hypothetical protein RRG08_003563 [Elysia crispata]|uniref:Uncharacterized protein n=1 Tax=Elysia crispata TaxID=231223 RepID=A0AAE0Y6M2_9GAST|nr:hypothetical protein RRG08_003563 [Elysia crispata]
MVSCLTPHELSRPLQGETVRILALIGAALLARTEIAWLLSLETAALLSASDGSTARLPQHCLLYSTSSTALSPLQHTSTVLHRNCSAGPGYRRPGQAKRQFPGLPATSQYIVCPRRLLALSGQKDSL